MIKEGEYVPYGNFRYAYWVKPLRYDVLHDMEVPKTFFKYYALKEHNVDALTHFYLYASHPDEFNDPFDCWSLLMNTDNYPQFSDYLFDVPDRCLLEQIKDIDDRNEIIMQHWRDRIYRQIGMVSMTTSRSILPMWAHYTEYKGFCLEFDIKEFTFEHWSPFPIDYVDSLIEIDFNHYNYLTPLLQSNTKKKDWSYEKEWRLYIQCPKGFDMQSPQYRGSIELPDAHDRKFRYPMTALKSITLAPKFFTQGRICNIQSNMFTYHAHGENEIIKVLTFLDQIRDIPNRSPMVFFMAVQKLNMYAQPIEVYRINDDVFQIVVINQ